MADSAVEKSLYIYVLRYSILKYFSSNEVHEPVEMSLFSFAIVDGSGSYCNTYALRGPLCNGNVRNGYSLTWYFHMFAALQLKHDIGGVSYVAHGCGLS